MKISTHRIPRNSAARSRSACVPACGLLAVLGCACSRPAVEVKPPPPDLARHAAIRREALREFGAADYGKPRCDDPSRLECVLAPLIVREVSAAGGAGGAAAPIARPVLEDGGPDSAVGGEPVVFASSSVAELGGATRAQVVYSWWSSDGGPSGQAVRLTLDRHGNPVIWEVSAAAGSPAVIFVAQSLERAAAREYGPPLPGRAFSVERALDETPHVVVARVLADSPVPVGPIVYVGAQGDISGVICRCMESQFSEIARTIEYRVAPLEELVEGGFAGAGSAGFLEAGALALQPGAAELIRADRLARCLRLPREW